MESSCDFVLHSVRSSNLNYIFQETTLPIFLTIRKSLTKTFKTEYQINTLENLEAEEKLKTKSNEEAFERLKCDFAEAIAENETSSKAIAMLEEKVKILHDKMNKGKVKIKTFETKFELERREKNKNEAKQNETIKENKNLNQELNETVIKLRLQEEIEFRS